MNNIEARFDWAWQQLDVHADPPELPGWLGGSFREARRVKKPFVVDSASKYDAEFDPNEDELAEIARATQGSGDRFSEQAVDAVAWYLPYVFHGQKWWGIYLNEEALLHVSAVVALQLRGTRVPLPFFVVEQAIRMLVLRHELGHFAVELAGSDFFSTAGNPSYVTAFASRPQHEEPTCTALEMTDLAVRASLPPKLRSAASELSAIWQSLPLPPPYSRWQNYAVTAIPGFVGLSNAMYGGHRGAAVMQQYFDFGFDSRRSVPVYLIASKGSIRDRLAAACPRVLKLDPKQIVRHARRCELAGVPAGVTVVDGNKHRYTIRRPNHRSVDIDTVKWDLADYRVAKELAALYEMSTDAYCREVQQF